MGQVAVGVCHNPGCSMHGKRQEIIVQQGQRMPCPICKGTVEPTGESYDRHLLQMHKRARAEGTGDLT